MELVIEGLDKLIYRTYHGRKISDIRIDKREPSTNSASYVFTFPPIDSIDGWNKKMEVYLCKYPATNGCYELFVMGLHGVTCYYLEREEIFDANETEKINNKIIKNLADHRIRWGKLNEEDNKEKCLIDSYAREVLSKYLPLIDWTARSL